MLRRPPGLSPEMQCFKAVRIPAKKRIDRVSYVHQSGWNMYMAFASMYLIQMSGVCFPKLQVAMLLGHIATHSVL